MEKNDLRYPLDELVDKRSIAQLKIERIENIEDKARLQEEYRHHTLAIEQYVAEGICTKAQVRQWHQELYDSNGRTWDLEAAIRKGQLGDLQDIHVLAEIGRTAIKIRESNGVRVAIKSKIVETIGIGYKDIKINHASQDVLKDYRSNP